MSIKLNYQSKNQVSNELQSFWEKSNEERILRKYWIEDSIIRFLKALRFEVYCKAGSNKGMINFFGRHIPCTKI